MMVRRPSTFGELISLRRTMDRVFDDPFFQVPTRQTRRMALDVFDTPDALVLEAPLAGVAPAHIDVSILGDVLTLTAGTDTAETVARDGYPVRRGRMTRSVTLPRGLRTDEASASFENGLLRLSIPKAAPVQRRQIAISVPHSASPATEAAPASETPPADPAATILSTDA